MTSATELAERAARASNPDTGLGPIRRALAQAICGAEGNRYGAAEYAARRWPADIGVELALQRKGAISALDTNVTALAPSPDAAAFLALVRSREIFAQLPALRRVPLARGVVLQTSGASVAWIDEGQPIPVTKLVLGRASLEAAKLASILVITKDLAEFSDPSAERLIRDDLVGATGAAASLKFLSDDAAAGGAPAGIAEGITPTASAADVVEDLMTVIDGFPRLDSVAVAMPVAAYILLGLTASGGPPFLAGLNVIPTDAADGRIIAFDQSRIAFGDAGVAIDSTEHATVQMDSAPDSFESVDADTVLVSLWQMNLLGLRAIRFLNWKRASDDAVAVISGATYS
jgi:hypothetical protein